MPVCSTSRRGALTALFDPGVERPDFEPPEVLDPLFRVDFPDDFAFEGLAPEAFFDLLFDDFPLDFFEEDFLLREAQESSDTPWMIR